MLVSIGQASLIIGVSVSTLRRWEREGGLEPDVRTLGGHRRYCIDRLREQFGLIREPANAGEKKTQNRKRLAA